MSTGPQARRELEALLRTAHQQGDVELVRTLDPSYEPDSGRAPALAHDGATPSSAAAAVAVPDALISLVAQRGQSVLLKRLMTLTQEAQGATPHHAYHPPAASAPFVSQSAMTAPQRRERALAACVASQIEALVLAGDHAAVAQIVPDPDAALSEGHLLAPPLASAVPALVRHALARQDAATLAQLIDAGAEEWASERGDHAVIALLNGGSSYAPTTSDAAFEYTSPFTHLLDAPYAGPPAAAPSAPSSWDPTTAHLRTTTHATARSAAGAAAAAAPLVPAAHMLHEALLSGDDDHRRPEPTSGGGHGGYGGYASPPRRTAATTPLSSTAATPLSAQRRAPANPVTKPLEDAMSRLQSALGPVASSPSRAADGGDDAYDAYEGRHERDGLSAYAAAAAARARCGEDVAAAVGAWWTSGWPSLASNPLATTTTTTTTAAAAASRPHSSP